jgi:hypothetical protein
MVLFRTITDDAGRRVPLYIPARRVIAHCRVPPEEFCEMRRSLVLHVDRRASPVLSLLSFFGLVFIVGLVIGLHSISLAGLLVVALLIAAWVFHDRRRLPTRNPGLIARCLLDRGRCASCAFPLAGVRPSREGLTQCPECGAAWHLHRVWVGAPPE